MLDRGVVLAHGEVDVGGGHVVLQVHPGAPPPGRLGQQWQSAPAVRELAGGRPDDREARDRCAGHECAELGVPSRTPEGMTVKVDLRRPSTRHGNEIRIDRAARSQPHSLDEGPADRSRDALAFVHDEARGAGSLRRSAGRTGIDDLAARAGLHQRSRQFVRGIVDRRDHRAFAGPHAVQPEVRERGVRQHHAGPVVVLEHQRSLQGPGREDHAARADDPRPFAVRADSVIDAAFDGDDRTVVVGRERHRVRQHRGATGLQFGMSGRDPVGASHALEHAAPPAERAADPGSLLDHQHPLSGPHRAARGVEAGDARTDHAGVEVQMPRRRRRSA